MTNYPDTVQCDGCGAEVFLAPVMRGERIYCCEDCANNRPCHCAERQEDDEDRRAPAGSDSAETSVPA